MKQIFKVGSYFFGIKAELTRFFERWFQPSFFRKFMCDTIGAFWLALLRRSLNNIAENCTQISTLNDCVNQAKKLLKCSKRGCQNKLCLEPLGNHVLRNLKVHVRVTENTSNFILSNICICPFTLNIKSYLQYCSANSMLLFEIEL